MILKSKRCHDITEVLKNKQPSSMELAWKPILDAYISLVIYLWAAWSNTLFSSVICTSLHLEKLMVISSATS